MIQGVLRCFLALHVARTKINGKKRWRTLYNNIIKPLRSFPLFQGFPTNDWKKKTESINLLAAVEHQQIEEKTHFAARRMSRSRAITLRVGASKFSKRLSAFVGSGEHGCERSLRAARTVL